MPGHTVLALLEIRSTPHTLADASSHSITVQQTQLGRSCLIPRSTYARQHMSHRLSSMLQCVKNMSGDTRHQHPRRIAALSERLHFSPDDPQLQLHISAQLSIRMIGSSRDTATSRRRPDVLSSEHPQLREADSRHPKYPTYAR